MFKVVRVDMVAGVEEFVEWFDSYEVAVAYAFAHNDGVWQHVVLEDDEEFVFL